MNNEVTGIRVTLQSLIAKAEEEYGPNHEFVSSLRSADDNLSDAEDYDFEADEEAEEEASEE